MKIELNKEAVAATVVLYNSPAHIIDNVLTYIDQVQKLYVVDNSILENEALVVLLSSYSNVQYHSLGGNKGIAAALNWAAKQAILDGFTVLLTMDDDTRVPRQMVSNFIQFWNAYPNPIGILSGIHHTKYDSSLYRKLPYTLTSGNMLNLIAFDQVGGFKDELFIDHVDHEFGLRLNINKFEVIELPSIRLDHKLGYQNYIRIVDGIVIKYGSHAPVRQYYFARNGVYVARAYFKLHPLFTWIFLKELAKRLIKASFLDKNKTKRFNLIIKGLRDGWKGKLGAHEA